MASSSAFSTAFLSLTNTYHVRPVKLKLIKAAQGNVDKSKNKNIYRKFCNNDPRVLRLLLWNRYPLLCKRQGLLETLIHELLHSNSFTEVSQFRCPRNPLLTSKSGRQVSPNVQLPYIVELHGTPRLYTTPTSPRETRNPSTRSRRPRHVKPQVSLLHSGRTTE